MLQEPSPITEADLIKSLQPIRGFVLAQALYYFMDSGIHEAIAKAGMVPISDLAHGMGLQEERLRGLLQYLANEGFVDLPGKDAVHLLDPGKQIATFQPWYKLLVGGYAQTLQQLSTALRAHGPYASRNSTNVGIGSCGISQYDALPMTRRLLARIPAGCGTVIDIGCGDGSYLLDLCRSLPHLRGIGLDPDPCSVSAASLAVSHYGLGDRVEIREGTATTLPDLSNQKGPFCFVTAFVLQEVLEQTGRSAIVEMLTAVFTKYPDSHWIVIEVDHRPEDTVMMRHGLGLAYYNLYYLIHHITEQRLEPIGFWEALFGECDLNTVAIEYPTSSYDPLMLKVGFLLSYKRYRAN